MTSQRSSRRTQVTYRTVLGLLLGSGQALAQGTAPPETTPPAPTPAPTAETPAEGEGATEVTEPPMVAPTTDVPPPESTAGDDTTKTTSPTPPNMQEDYDVPPDESPVQATTPEPPIEEEYLDISDLEAELADASTSGPKLDIYGFADFTYQQWLKNELPGVKPTFAVGNFNVYLATDFGSNWRALSEVRFLYLPHGAPPASDPFGTRLDTTVQDYADIQRPLRWGGVEIERVWLEYALDPLLSIRGGQWLTPYGIWNVDHGSPVIIATNRPYIVGEALFPERQTGLQLHGFGFVGTTKLGYHLTLSNGRGPTDAYADLDANKAVGARVFMQNGAVLGDFTLGFSAYAGRYTDRANEFTVGADGAPAFGSTITDKYDELGYAADLKWVLEGFHLQSEVVVHEVTYDESYRPSDLFGRPGLIPDYRRWGGYALVGYRISSIELMPYVNAEYYEDGPTGLYGSIPAFWFGLNLRPVPSIVLKAQYLYANGKGTDITGDLPSFQFVTTQAAWSF